MSMSNKIHVVAYRIKVKPQTDDAAIDNFIEAMSTKSIATLSGPYAIMVIASSDVITATGIENMAILFFGKTEYEMSLLGYLGPFKK